MASSPHKILVVGATGQQGGALLSELAHLSSSSSSPVPISSLKILALTRSSSSAKAQAVLKSFNNTLDTELVEGDTRDPDPIFAKHGDISAVFCFTTPPAAEEGAQAIALIDAAAANGVKRFVFSSVDRGGDEKSWDNPTDVPHFKSKHEIEHHLRRVCTSHPSMTYTILRPAAFMDNLNPTSYFGAVMAGLMSTMPSNTSLQMVSVHDIGVFAARALLSSLPSSLTPSPNTTPEVQDQYTNRAVSLAGDDLTLLEARSIYRRVAKSQLPQAWSIFGYGLRWMVKDVGNMFTFFEREGYGVDIQKLRDEEPRLQSFETWLRESSKFEWKGKGSSS
ncbi:nucleoside-diphosphate-sugar epimerase family protein [Xylariaceae sp. FL1019]|nr:nucleoside-diphosphate-sugar epimerase family protein [Xylariaceae sp. FL1019]